MGKPTIEEKRIESTKIFAEKYAQLSPEVQEKVLNAMDGMIVMFKLVEPLLPNDKR